MTEQHTTPPSRSQRSATDHTDTKGGMPKSEAHVSLDSEAAVGVSDALHFADVAWRRSLQGRLEDVAYYGLSILPYEELCSLAINKASPRAWSMRELQKYLSVLLSCDLHSKYADGFSSHFCLALDNCCTELQQGNRLDQDNRQEDMLWVYAPGQIELPCIRRLPCAINDSIEAILEMLREYPDNEDSCTFEEDTRLWVANRICLRQSEQTGNGVSRTLRLDALTEAWRREGYHEHLLRGYVWYRMIKQAPSRQHEVNLFASQLFDKPWEAWRWDPTDDRNDGSDLRIHYMR